jgi:hypothetical protein
MMQQVRPLAAAKARKIPLTAWRSGRPKETLLTPKV